MNDAAQSSSRMVSKIKSSFVSPSNQNNDQPAAPTAVGSAMDNNADANSNNNTQPAQLSDQQKLAAFETVLNRVENQSVNQLNPAHAVKTSGKEAINVAASPDQGPVDAGAIQNVEAEKSPEIPVEVEGYLQKVDDLAEERPPEVFITDGTKEAQEASYPSRPVVVLPITQKVEEAGQKKNATFSIRWLVEWSHKIIKMFAGKVIYRQETV